MMTLEEFWNDASDPRGVLHRPTSRDDGRYLQDTVVVYVHGFLGDEVKTWGETPLRLAREVPAESKLLVQASASYPTWPHQKTSLDLAAERLATWLTETKHPANDALHVVFITHSTGGLVVKKVLADDYRRTLQSLSKSGDCLENGESLWLKTRSVINLGVPHWGAKPYLTYPGLVVYGAMLPFVYGLMKPLSLIRNWPKGVGYNGLIPTLRYGNGDLKALEDEYQDSVRDADDRGLPRPVSTEVCGWNDVVVPELAESAPARTPLGHKAERPLTGWTVASDARKATRRVRATHTTMKKGVRDSVPVLNLIQRRLARHTDELDLRIAYKTVAWIHLINQRDGVQGLNASKQPEETQLPYRCFAGSQQEVFSKLYGNLMQRGQAGSRLHILTGGPLSGKSIVVRELARSISRAYLLEERDDPMLQILLPLHFVHPTAATEEEFMRLFDKPFRAPGTGRDEWASQALDFLLKWWCGWSGQFLGRAVEPSWLRERLQRRRTVLILDGVDTFLLRYNVGVKHIDRILRELRRRFQSNHGLYTVLSLETTLGRVNFLQADAAKEIYQVLHPCEEDYRSELRNWLNRIPDAELHEFAASQLIAPWIDTKHLPDPTSRVAIMEHVIHQMMLDDEGRAAPPLPTLAKLLEQARKSVERAPITRVQSGQTTLDALYAGARESASRELHGVEAEVLTALQRTVAASSSGARVQDRHWITALSLIARLSHWESRTNLWESDFRPGAWRVAAEWVRHREQARERGPDDILVGFALVLNRETRTKALSWPIFLPAAERTVRFRHEEWEHFLVAHYLSLCVRKNLVGELGTRAFRPRIYTQAGARVSDIEFTEDRVTTIIRVLDKTWPAGEQKWAELRRFALGNLFTIISNSGARIQPAALQSLWGSVDPEDAGLRFMVLSSLCYGCYAGLGEAVQLKNVLIRILTERLQDPEENLLLRSLAWCYLDAFEATPNTRRPTLTFDRDQQAESLRLTCEERPGAAADATLFDCFRIPRRNRTVHQGLLRYLEAAARDDRRHLSAVHYLHCLICVGINDLDGGDSFVDLARLLRPDSGLVQGIRRRAQRMPHVHEILDACLGAFREYTQKSNPPALMFAYDDHYQLGEEEMYRNPYPIMAEMRKGPITWNDTFGAWILTRYDDVKKVLAEQAGKVSSQRRTAKLPETSRPELAELKDHLKNWLVFMDGDEYERLRKVAHDGLSAEAIDRLRTPIQDTVRDLLTAIEGQERIDLMESLARPLPLHVLGRLMQIPYEACEREIKPLCEDLIFYLGSRKNPDKALASLRSLTEFFEPTIGNRKRVPGDDLISRLVRSGNHLQPNEIVSLLVMMFIGGHETTTNLIGNGLFALLRDPEKLAELRSRLRSDEPEGVLKTAVQELARFDSPLQRISRTSLAPALFREVWVGKDEPMMLLLGAANRDSRAFDGADELVLNRHPNEHLAFGHRLHHCMGSRLGCLEAATAIRAVLEKFPDLRLSDRDKPEWQNNPAFRGLIKLPVQVGS